MKKKIFFLLATFIALVGVRMEAQVLKGNATYYANRFHGRKTSSGELYNKDSMTCAHRTLPFGTWLKVRNVRNGKEVKVRVTDRGPFRHDAIIDLSYAAAKKLDMILRGIVRVEVERINTLSPYIARPKKEIEFPKLKIITPDSLRIDLFEFPIKKSGKASFNRSINYPYE